MSTAIIRSLRDLANRNEICSQIETIFFQTSSVKQFPSVQERESFKNRWLSPYLLPETLCSVWVAMIDKSVVGYLTGHSNTALYRIAHDHASLSLFADLHENFPAHLHINMSPGQQGKGLGAMLIQTYVQELRTKGISGVHLVTGHKARNTSFYRREGFSHEFMRLSGNVELLFMGQKLD